MPFGIGAGELLILLLVILLVFGPKRLPEMGRSLGRSMREFKDSISGQDFHDDRPADADQLSQATENEPVTPAESGRAKDTVS